MALSSERCTGRHHQTGQSRGGRGRLRGGRTCRRTTCHVQQGYRRRFLPEGRPQRCFQGRLLMVLAWATLSRSLQCPSHVCKPAWGCALPRGRQISQMRRPRWSCHVATSKRARTMTKINQRIKKEAQFLLVSRALSANAQMHPSVQGISSSWITWAPRTSPRVWYSGARRGLGVARLHRRSSSTCSKNCCLILNTNLIKIYGAKHAPSRDTHKIKFLLKKTKIYLWILGWSL